MLKTEAQLLPISLPLSLIITMTSQSTYVSVAPSPRLRDTQTTAPAELVKLRVQHLLPHTTRRAKARVDALKRLFAMPNSTLLAEQADAAAATLHRLRLVKSVRNLKVQGSDASSISGVVGALCLPLHACAALPQLSAEGTATPLSGVLTGSVDGLLTLWDAEQCTPLCSQSTFPEGRAWGRVKSIAVYPTCGGAASAGSSAIAFTASMFQSEVRVWRVAADNASARNEEEEGSTTAAPSASLQPLTTAPTEASTERQGGLQSVAVDATGALLAATHDSGVVHVWDARTAIEGTAAPLLRLYAQDGYETAGATHGVAFHPDGSLLTTTDAGGRVVAFDTRSGQLAFHTGGRVGAHLRAARCLAWSPCGVRLASGGDDGVVQIYDARRLSRAGPGVHKDGGSSAAPFLLLGHEDAITSLGFYANPLCRRAGSCPSLLPVGLITTSLDQTMRVWDADTGLCVKALDAGMPLYSHCRPALQPLSATRFAESTAVMVVGHGKNWLLYDVGLRGDALDDDPHVGDASRNGPEEGAVQVQVQETDIVASPHGAAGTMRFSVAASASAQVVAAAAGDDSSSEEEEDEMVALMKPTAVVVAPPSASNKDDENEEEETSSEDEMEALRKKASTS